jgi:ABC-2 type transport system ATP-binding protein
MARSLPWHAQVSLIAGSVTPFGTSATRVERARRTPSGLPPNRDAVGRGRRTVARVSATPVISIEGLRKEYRRFRGQATVAVDGLDLSVPAGGVFGFLGPNGAGKTTTIRTLLGLARPTAGRCRVFGVDAQHEYFRVQRRVGTMIETQALFLGFSGRRNLSLLAGMEGIPESAVDEALDRVGLADRAGDRLETYSLGMKQRLGLAAALVKDPELLVLDEPANGLDPAGIRDVRRLLRRLGDEGRTVFVSSHLLGEVQQMCDKVAVLSQGRCVATGSVAEVLASAGMRGVVVRLADLVAGRAALEAAGYSVSEDGQSLVVGVDPSAAPHVAEALAVRDLYPLELRPGGASLEEAFLTLTGETPDGSL